MKLIIPILIGLFNISLLMYPREVMDAARDGLMLWFNTVLPSLLPFIVGIGLSMRLGFIRFIGTLLSPLTTQLFGVSGAGGVAFVTGLVSGYPIGAKTVGDLHKAGDISSTEAERLILFCNNAGPLFIIGAVGVGMFGSLQAGYILWAGHTAAALLLGILYRIFRGKVYVTPPKNNLVHTAFKELHLHLKNNDCHPGKVLGESVKSAMEALLLVGGLIIFFNVVVQIVLIITEVEGLTGGLVGGIFEITGGTREISNAGIFTLPLALAAFVIAFGGLSVHAQALHFTAGTGVRTFSYIIGKLCHGILSATLTVLIWNLTQW